MGEHRGGGHHLSSSNCLAGLLHVAPEKARRRLPRSGKSRMSLPGSEETLSLPSLGTVTLDARARQRPPFHKLVHVEIRRSSRLTSPVDAREWRKHSCSAAARELAQSRGRSGMVRHDDRGGCFPRLPQAVLEVDRQERYLKLLKRSGEAPRALANWWG